MKPIIKKDKCRKYEKGKLIHFYWFKINVYISLTFNEFRVHTVIVVWDYLG
jgi:hypothetical protein